MSPVSLSKIIDALESQSAEANCFLNTKTGEIVRVAEEEFGLDRDLDDSSEETPEDDTESSGEIINSQDYIQLPDPFEINEYRMMEDFSLSLSNEDWRETLYHSIKGSGAFRRFKDKIRRMGIEKDWYNYRDQQLKEIAIAWCEGNNIPYNGQPI